MRLIAGLILLIVTMLIECVPRIDLPSGSSDSGLPGYARLRMKAHRRRHRHKSTNHLEGDDLFDMLTEQLEKDKEEYRAFTRKTKNTINSRKERNEDLCLTERRTIDLNTDKEEFDPPFLVEIRCQNTADYEWGVVDVLKEQTCVHDLLRCVQRYGEVHVSRRSVGTAHWSPHTIRSVPLGCDCMWPIDRYGHQEL